MSRNRPPSARIHIPIRPEIGERLADADARLGADIVDHKIDTLLLFSMDPLEIEARWRRLIADA